MHYAHSISLWRSKNDTMWSKQIHFVQCRNISFLSKPSPTGEEGEPVDNG